MEKCDWGRNVVGRNVMGEMSLEELSFEEKRHIAVCVFFFQLKVWVKLFG